VVYTFARGPLAQWSELAAHTRSVAGSSPAGPTTRDARERARKRPFDATRKSEVGRYAVWLTVRTRNRGRDGDRLPAIGTSGRMQTDAPSGATPRSAANPPTSAAPIAYAGGMTTSTTAPMVLPSSDDPGLLPLAQIAATHGLHHHRTTLGRWVRHGVAGVRLPAVVVGGRLRTTSETFARWLAAIAAAQQEGTQR
jgi:hypothetical protein